MGRGHQDDDQARRQLPRKMRHVPVQVPACENTTSTGKDRRSTHLDVETAVVLPVRNVPARCSQTEIEELLSFVTWDFRLQMPRSSERKCKGYAFIEGRVAFEGSWQSTLPEGQEYGHDLDPNSLESG